VYGSNRRINVPSTARFWNSRPRKFSWPSASFWCALALLPLAGFSRGEAAESYSDDFVGDGLRPEWRIENEDVNRYGVVEGNYLLLVSNDDGRNAVVKTIDGTGDFTIELVGNGTLSLGPYGSDMQKQACISVGVRFIKDNRINVSACTDRTYLSKSVEGEWNGFEHQHERFSRFLLRLKKEGVQYSGTVVLDGNEIELGSHFMPQAPSAVFIAAVNGSKDVPEAGILVDRISITPN
jgi:hypothetical protein